MFDLGDVVPLSVTVRDADGQPANAGAVNLTIYLPDGTTTAVGPVTPTSVGVYDHDFTATQAGRHGVRWAATGANASAYTDAFVIEPTDPDGFISLADVKAHMDKTRTDDDEELAGFIQAACRMIRERIGNVTPVSFTEDRRGEQTIVLEQRPIISVTSVATLPGLTAMAQADPANSVAGWTLDGGAAVLEHTTRFGHVRITYRAGRTPVPANIRLAALELVAHLWRSSQLNSGGGRPQIADDELPVMPGAAFALPIRVRELLGLGARMMTNEVLCG